MTAKTVFEVYKALNPEEQNLFLTLAKNHAENNSKGSFLESEAILTILKNWPEIFKIFMSHKNDSDKNLTPFKNTLGEDLAAFILKSL